MCSFVSAHYVLDTVFLMLHGLLCTSQDSQLQTISIAKQALVKFIKKELYWKAVGWLPEVTGRLES